MSNVGPVVLALWNPSLTDAIVFFVCGVGVFAFSRQMAAGYEEDPNDTRRRVTWWNLKFADIPEGRLRLAFRVIAVMFLALAAVELTRGLVG